VKVVTDTSAIELSSAGARGGVVNLQIPGARGTPDEFEHAEHSDFGRARVAEQRDG